VTKVKDKQTEHHRISNHSLSAVEFARPETDGQIKLAVWNWKTKTLHILGLEYVTSLVENDGLQAIQQVANCSCNYTHGP